MPNSTRLWKLLTIAEFRIPTHQDVRKKGSKILKLPSVRNCFTLAMTNKLVIIINSLKVPKIKKLLLYEMKFLVPNYSCLQNPWLGGRGLPPPQIPVLCPLPSSEFVEPPPPLLDQNSWVRHCSFNSGVGCGFLYNIFTFFLLYPIDCSYSVASYRTGGVCVCVCYRRHLAYISVYILYR